MKSPDNASVIIPISLGFVNAYIVKQAGVILIDTGIPGSEQKILDAFNEHGLKPHDISLIIITHGHQDHAGSAAALQEISGAPVVCHTDDAGFLAKGKQNTLKPCSMTGFFLQFFFNRKKLSEYPPVRPDILVDALFDLEPYGVSGKVISTPGHTKGSIVVALNSGERFTGDLIFPKIPSGKPGFPFWAEEPDLVLDSIRKICDDNCSMIYPGHGRPFQKGEILEMVIGTGSRK
ncbi:MBL fold metallo-hydrolase [Methanospirillum hungatei]|uniref:MBL fold metallo-hydrolase n=1 Tax=Methanospirillum hungatei TaxID=2203 RepID=UPI0026F18B1D|nr:MBL fold metallo-hydrolase [Methanospirillum hungatei]MCA1917280.1 MBL fold metallo-hydrolase [Methanospirillum hungatei]